MNGRRGLVDKGVYLFPDVLRVPLVFKMPAKSGIKHKTVAAPVAHLDFAPTLLEVAGVEPQEWLDGRSLLPDLQGTSMPSDRDFLFECGWHTGVNFARGIQHWKAAREHYLYSYNLASTVDELYDLEASDAENLAFKPAQETPHGDDPAAGRCHRERPALDRLLARLPRRSLFRSTETKAGRSANVPARVNKMCADCKDGILPLGSDSMLFVLDTNWPRPYSSRKRRVFVNYLGLREKW